MSSGKPGPNALAYISRAKEYAEKGLFGEALRTITDGMDKWTDYKPLDDAFVEITDLAVKHYVAEGREYLQEPTHNNYLLAMQQFKLALTYDPDSVDAIKGLVCAVEPFCKPEENQVVSNYVIAAEACRKLARLVPEKAGDWNGKAVIFEDNLLLVAREKASKESTLFEILRVD